MEGIFNNLSLNFVFEDLSVIPKECLEVCEEVKEIVTNTTELLMSNFTVQKVAIINYREENDVRFCKEEETLIKKAATLSKDIELSKESLTGFEEKIKAIEVKLDEGAKRSQQLENQRKHLLSEKDKVVEALERVRKGYDLAILIYQRNLGMVLNTDRTDPDRFVVAFEPTARSQLFSKITFTKLSGGYQLDDGIILKTKTELMTWLWKERKNWLATDTMEMC